MAGVVGGCAGAIQVAVLAAGVTLLLPHPLGAQEVQRSGVVRAQGKLDVQEGRRVFVGVGINTYERSDLWPELRNPGKDVRDLRDVLRDHYGFADLPDLVRFDLDYRRFFLLVDSLKEQLKPDDSLVFFFAGHGAMDADGLGYLVPSDVRGTPDDVPSQYVRIEHLLDRLNRLRVRHVLVILDSCKSGLSLEGAEKPPTDDDQVDRWVEDLRTRESRRVMSSGRQAQNVGDGTDRNSPFASWLLTALRHAAEGRTPAPGGDDGYLTAKELFEFVQREVGQRFNQIPDFGRFGRDRHGLLVLNLQRNPIALFVRAVDAYRKRTPGLAIIVEEAQVQMTGFPAHAEYLRYLVAKAGGDELSMLEAIKRIVELVAAGEELQADLPEGSWRALIQEKDRLAASCKRGCPAGKDGG